MHRVSDVFVVNRFYSVKLFLRKIGRGGSCGIAFCMLGARGSWNYAADGLLHEHKLERTFRQRPGLKDPL